MCEISLICYRLAHPDAYSTGSISAADASSPGSPSPPYNPIQAFLRYHSPGEGQEFGVSAGVMETFLRSCAGYSVISYILGECVNKLYLFFSFFPFILFRWALFCIDARDSSPFRGGHSCCAQSLRFFALICLDLLRFALIRFDLLCFALL